MNKLTGLLLLLIISPITLADTLLEVIQRTIETSPDILITTNSHQAIAQQIVQAKAGYLPKIDIVAGYGKQVSDNSSTRSSGSDDLTLSPRELNLTLSQLLFDGFGTQAKVAQQRYLLDSAAHQVKETCENVALLTAEVYLEILRRQEIVELNKNNVVVHQKTLDQIKTLVEGGVGRQADLQQTTSRLALAKSSLVNAQGQLRNSEINYHRVTGEVPKQLTPPEFLPLETALPPSAEAALELALRNHPSLRSASAELAAAQEAFQQTKSVLLPQVTLELSASDNKNLSGIPGDNDELSAMVRMRYNLFRGGADHASKQETVERMDVAKEVIRRTERVVEEEALLSWNSLLTIRARLDYLKGHLQSSEEVLESYKEQFKLGQRSLLDVLDSENELFNARTSWISAYYAERLSMLKVLESVGLLLETLGIKLPAETKVRQR
jgi:adhesin transport system outer membrane protein